MRIGHGARDLIEEQGLTLVEILIAMAILSVSVLGVVGMFPVAYEHVRAGGDVTKATGLAQRMIELLRDERVHTLQRYHQADTRQESTFPVDALEEIPPFLGGSAFHRWREEITSTPLARAGHESWGRIEVTPLQRGLWSVAITVGWAAPPAERTVFLTTLVGQR